MLTLILGEITVCQSKVVVENNQGSDQSKVVVENNQGSDQTSSSSLYIYIYIYLEPSS